MAEIRQRGSTYQISVFLGRDEDQKKIYKRTTFTPTATTPKAIEKEVRKFADDFEKRAKEGDVLDGESLTFQKFVPVWEEGYCSKLSQRVRDDYVRTIRAYFLPAFGFMKLSSIKSVHIDRVLNEMKDQGKAPKTIHNVFTAISSVMKYAFRKGLIRENPCLRCDPLPAVERDNELHYFTVEQAKTFLKALTLEYEETRAPVTRHLKDGKTLEIQGYTMHDKISPQWEVYFSLAIYGGFRRGELIALTWEDVDFDKRTINIEKAISRTESSQIVKAPKTKAGYREIILPSECFRLLRAWRSEELRLALNLGTAWKGYRDDDFDKNHVFISTSDGTRMSVDSPTHKFQEVIELYNTQKAHKEEEKLPKIRLHDLRHTSATLLLANHCDIETVSKRLGHSKASITLDVYGHAMEEMDRKASETLEKLFSVG